MSAPASEDELIAREDPTREHTEWRVAYGGEAADAEWTRSTQRALARRARELSMEVSVENLECRQTICRMYLQFSSESQASSFLSSLQEPDLLYRHQLVGTGTPGAYQYEVMVKRPYEGSPPQPASASDDLVLKATASSTGSRTVPSSP